MDLLVCPDCGAVSTKSGLLVRLGTVSAESQPSPHINSSDDSRYHCPACKKTLPDAQQDILLENLARVIPSLSLDEKLAIAKILYHHAATWDAPQVPLDEAIARVAPKARIIALLSPHDRTEFLQYVTILLSILALADSVVSNYFVSATASVPKVYVSQPVDHSGDHPGDQSGDDWDDESDDRHGNESRDEAVSLRSGASVIVRYKKLSGPFIHFRGEATLSQSVFWGLLTPNGNHSAHPHVIASSSGSWTWDVDARKNSLVWFFLSDSSETQAIRRLSARNLERSYFATHRFSRYRIVHVRKNKFRVRSEVRYNKS